MIRQELTFSYPSKRKHTMSTVTTKDGMCTTHKDQVNEDLLAFIKG